MTRKEPVSNWQAFWLVFLTATGTAAVLWLAGVPAPWVLPLALFLATAAALIVVASRPQARQVSDWLMLHPWIGASLAFGILLGVALGLFVEPPKLSDSHASLIGAAFGAIAAVWGAAWVADGKERRAKALARRYIRQHLWVFTTTLKQEIDRAEKALDVGDVGTVTDACGKLVNLSSATRPVLEKSLPAMQPMFASLGPAGIIAAVDLQHAIQAVLATLDTLVDPGAYVQASENLLAQKVNIDITLATMDRG